MLSIIAAQVTDESLAHLRSLVSLDELRLSAIPSLKGPGMEYVRDCPRLRSISLYGVPINNDGLMCLGKMDQLEKLHLQSTRVTGEGLVHLTALKNLRELTLPEGITDTDLLHISHLTGLEKLSVNCKNVSDESLGHLQDFPELQDLTITFSRLSEKKVACIRALPSLRRLAIYLDSLEDKDIRLIQGLTCLVGLYPGSQWITDDGLAHLRDMNALENLSLHGMPITDAGLSCLSGLTGLKDLDLTGTKTTDAGLAHLSGLSALQHMNLSDTKITGVGLTYLKSLSHLSVLSLDNCPIDNSTIPSLKGLTLLQGLNIRRTYIDEQGLEELKQALPNCRIGWQVPQLRIGEPAPQITIDGFVQAPSDAVATWDALKDKVVVLEFWATWCVPCIDAMPHINSLVDHFKDNPVQFISITKEAEGLVKNFLREHTLKSWVAVDANGSMSKACMAIRIPYCVVVDKRGIVRARFHPMQLTEKTIQDLLDE